MAHKMRRRCGKRTASRTSRPTGSTKESREEHCSTEHASCQDNLSRAASEVPELGDASGLPESRLRQTRDAGEAVNVCEPQEKPTCFTEMVDSEHADDKETRRSTTRAVMKHGSH
eukprot:367404-Amphidinium_carterae.1